MQNNDLDDPRVFRPAHFALKMHMRSASIPRLRRNRYRASQNAGAMPLDAVQQ